MLAWGAERAAAGALKGTGALGPVDAFGLDELVVGCAEAGISEEARGARRGRDQLGARARTGRLNGSIEGSVATQNLVRFRGTAAARGPRRGGGAGPRCWCRRRGWSGR